MPKFERIMCFCTWVSECVANLSSGVTKAQKLQRNSNYDNFSVTKSVVSKFFAELHLLLDPQSEGHDEIRHDIELRETGIRKYDNGGKNNLKKRSKPGIS